MARRRLARTERDRRECSDDGRYDGERAYWSKWCVPAIRYDCDYGDEMKAFRKEVRDAIIRKRRVKKEDVPAFMERLEILHYNFIMLPSQNMDDDLCRRAYDPKRMFKIEMNEKAERRPILPSLTLDHDYPTTVREMYTDPNRCINPTARARLRSLLKE